MRGSICKIILNNFITYEHVELTPGKKMNMIIGPNGSGKSSVLCGICLGLGGKPKSIGRVTKVGDYVKTGCNEAMIHIELANGTDDRVTVITRIINKSGGTTWSVNGKQSNQKHVEEVVASMSIHMDNLCQFLSQERVQDFTKMNPKELLANTEKTVGTSEMYDHHQRLIEMSKNSSDNEKNLAAITTSLEREMQKCEELRIRMESVTERMELLDKIKNLKAKKPWLEYNEHLKLLQEVKNDFKLASDALKERKKELVPVEQAIKLSQTRLAAIKEEMKIKVDHTVALQRATESQDKMMQKLVENQRELNQKIEDEEKRLNELKTMEQRLVAYERDLQRAMEEYDPEQSREQIMEQNQKIQILDKSIQSKYKVQGLKRREISEKENELRDIEHELSRLTSVEQKRLNVLRNMDMDSHKATLWVRENANQFKGLVYGAIMLEINMYDPADSKYLESLIAKRDQKALLCERTDDMNQLVPLLKSRLGVRINMLQSPNEAPSDATQKNRKELKRMGFDKYVTDLFRCPLPIFNYLCRINRLHLIPIAATEEQVNHEEAQKHFSRYFAGNKFFSITKSRYSGQSSTRVSPFGGVGLFADSVDPTAASGVEARKLAVKEIKERLMLEMQELQEEMRAEEAKKEQARRRKQELSQMGDKIKEMRITCDRHRAKIENMRKHCVNIEEEKAKCRRENKGLMRKVCGELPKLADLLEKACAQQTQLALLAVEERGMLTLQIAHEDQLKELRNNLKELERQVETLKHLVEERKREGRNLLDEAKKVSGCAPGDAQFTRLQKIFETLPETLHDIECAIKEIEGRLEFFGDEDENVVDEYAKQQKLVEKLDKDLVRATNAVKNRKREMDAIRDRWLPPLQKLARQISSKFEQLFEYMKCVGEVVLTEGQPNVEDDYENYGLQIRVKFRDNEELQELCGTQSGGERSVSTAIYLLALQELTQVPFRCMDEINQGMDPTNERRIMNLMMRLSEHDDSCQYFVVTPKLLPELTYTPSCSVMCVSQPKIMDTSKWTMSSFLHDARASQKFKKSRME